jgi:pilus assembly protein TadC
VSAAGAAAVLAAAAAWLLIGGAAGSLGRLAGPSSSRFDVARGLAAVGARRRRRGADLPLVRQLPEALDLLAACLDAGLPMVAAVETVSESSPPATKALLGGVAAEMRLGRVGGLAWRELRAHRVWGRVAGDLARAERSGLALADGLRAHAEDARAEAREAAIAAARTVGVRSVVPLMACFLPAFVLVGVVPIIASLLGDLLG